MSYGCVYVNVITPLAIIHDCYQYLPSLNIAMLLTALTEVPMYMLFMIIEFVLVSSYECWV